MKTDGLDNTKTIDVAVNGAATLESEEDTAPGAKDDNPPQAADSGVTQVNVEVNKPKSRETGKDSMDQKAQPNKEIIQDKTGDEEEEITARDTVDNDKSKRKVEEEAPGKRVKITMDADGKTVEMKVDSAETKVKK